MQTVTKTLLQLSFLQSGLIAFLGILGLSGVVIRWRHLRRLVTDPTALEPMLVGDNLWGLAAILWLVTGLLRALQLGYTMLADAHGLKLLLEPINNYDVPGFWLNHTAKAIAVLDEVGADNAYVQYDIYHAQRYEGELAATMTRCLKHIGHIQVADNPGRNEPGTGEIHYPFLFAHLDRIGYQGWIGCEYKPATTTEAGLGWRQSLVR